FVAIGSLGANQIPSFFGNLYLSGDLALAGFDELSLHADVPNEVVFAKPVDPSEHKKWVSHREHSAAKCCADQVPGKNIGLMCHDRVRSILRNVFGFDAGTEIGWPVPHKPFQELWADSH